MNELVIVKRDEVYTDSLIVAREFEKNHDDVLRDIRNQIEKLREAGETEFSLLNFAESKYINERGREYLKIDLSEEGFAIVAMAYVTPNAMRMKVRFIKEFKRMRQFILERQTAEWRYSRLTGKKVRRDETDIILTKLIPLAESQGSDHAEKLYMIYSKLVNRTLGLEAGKREDLPLAYIEAIKFLERAIENIISIEVDKGTHYKEIYHICKSKCQIIKDLAFLPSLKMIS